jgi:hypothetical protein
MPAFAVVINLGGGELILLQWFYFETTEYSSGSKTVLCRALGLDEGFPDALLQPSLVMHFKSTDFLNNIIDRDVYVRSWIFEIHSHKSKMVHPT